MVRAPCCEKMGLKKGPWAPEEDQVLVSYIQKNGHGNWRALPKEAGLLRCGKSCRLRWTNYLRPDIKRGNFSKEEEETIIKLHEMLGNRWSTIASRLPGRTDNEIKNVWHTHLKKKLNNYQASQETKRHPTTNDNNNAQKSDPITLTTNDSSDADGKDQNADLAGASPQHSSSETSMATEGATVIKQEEMDSLEYVPQIDESFWSDDLSGDNGNNNGQGYHILEFPFSPIAAAAVTSHEEEDFIACTSKCGGDDDDGGMDFWYDLFIRAGDLPELPEF